MLEALAQRSAWVFCRMSLGHQGRGGYPNPCCGITSTITMLAWIAHAMWCNSLVAAVRRSTTWRCQTRRCRRILTTPQDEAQTRSSLSSNNASVAGLMFFKFQSAARSVYLPCNNDQASKMMSKQHFWKAMEQCSTSMKFQFSTCNS